MMNSDARREAAAIIKEVLELSSEEYLYRCVDEPLERVAAAFEFDREARVTHQTFFANNRQFCAPRL